MKKSDNYLIILLLMFSFSLIGQIPQTISYQGVLTDNNDAIVPDGDYPMTFNLYNVETSGSPLWTEAQTVTIGDGIFNVILGAVNPLQLPFDEKYWLGIIIDSGSELSPRIEFTTSAYSFKSLSVADSSINSNDIADDQMVRSINSLKDEVFVKGGNNISVNQNGDSLIIAATGIATGDITSVEAGLGLSGGGTSGDVALNVLGGTGIGVGDSVILDLPFTDSKYVNEGQANSVNSAMIQENIVSSIDGVSNDGGNIDLVAGSNVTITPNNSSNTITISASGSSLWNQNGSDLYYNSGNVGIGTSVPWSPFTIVAGTSSRGLSLTHNQTAASSAFGMFVDVNRTGTGNADAYGIWSTATNDNGLWSTRGLMAAANGNATGPKYGVFATAEGAGALYGVKGVASSLGTSPQYGIWGEAIGSGTGAHYGVYGTTSGGGSNHWAGYFNGNTYVDGSLGIGTLTPSTGLEVADTIYSSSGGFRFPDGTVQTTAAAGGGSGDITAVIAGNGLTGGGDTGDVTLNADFAGTGAANTVSRSDHDHDAAYVNEGQANSIATSMIVNDAVTAAKVSPDIVSSIDGVSNDAGNIDLVAGSNVTITPNNTANTITISASSQAGNTLDQAYDQGGSGAGRTIVADNGAVNITGSNGLTVNGNVGIGTTTATYPLTILPGTNERGLMIDHDQTATSSDTRGLVVDMDKTSSGDTQLYGSTFWATNNNGAGVTRGIFSSVDGTSTGIKIGIQGSASGGGDHYGVSGSASGSGTQYGIYGSASGSGTLWAGYFNTGNVHIANNLGIGTSNPVSALSVGGDGYLNTIIYGESSILGGRGVRGYASNNGNSVNYGGYFSAAGGAGVGVFGSATNTGDVRNYGGSFISEGQNGIGVYGSASNTTQGSYNKYGGYFSAASSTGIGVQGSAPLYGVYGTSAYSGIHGYVTDGVGRAIYGSVGSSTGNYAGFFNGNVECTGGYTKSFSKTKIDHPLDPENKYLYHSSVESSDMMNVYNGNVLLNSSGEAWVDLPDWFEAYNKEFRYQLTCIGGFAQVYISEEVKNNRFKIAGGKPDMKISWQITGIRKDKLAEQFRVVVEQDKPVEERGKYLHPEAFGLDESRGIGYEEEKMMHAERTDIVNQVEEDF